MINMKMHFHRDKISIFSTISLVLPRITGTLLVLISEKTTDISISLLSGSKNIF